MASKDLNFLSEWMKEAPNPLLNCIKDLYKDYDRKTKYMEKKK